MPKEFKLPDLGEGIHEGEIIDVLVSVGDRVVDGQPILVVETDKATTELPSPVNGIVKEIRVKPGDMVRVGEVLMTFFEEGEERRTQRPDVDAGMVSAERVAPPKGVSGDKGMETPPEIAEAERVIRGPFNSEGAKPDERSSGPPESTSGPVAATPSTRRLARELGVDLGKVPSSGPGGRVTAEDVREYAERVQAADTAPKTGLVEETREAAHVLAIPTLPDFGRWGAVERVPLRSVRRATARQMALAWSQIPHVAHQDVADVTALDAFRRKHKGYVAEQGGALSLTVFALKAAAIALKAYPRFNASLDTETEEIILKHYFHIGVAVDTDRGLIVPVIRDVDRKNLTELSKEIYALVHRTRDGKAERDEMLGGTFTITNIGIIGGTSFVPIINHPQVAILGLAQARFQPVVRGGAEDAAIVPRLVLPLILGFDHRVVDGADAARFLNMVITLLEDPEKLLMAC